MIDKSLLFSGNDIPFISAQMNIRQPKIKEVVMLTEKGFFQGCEILALSLDSLKTEDKINLGDKTNFDVFMSIINDKSELTQQSRDNCIDLLTLLFPDYSLGFQENFILFTRDGEMPHSINRENYNDFKQILEEMFCLRKKKEDEYNPEGERATELANRFKKRRAEIAAAKGQTGESSLFDRYCSILSIGMKMDVNIFLEKYTVYQLYDAFERFSLENEYSISLSARMAGAKSESLDKVEHWMKDIHS